MMVLENELVMLRKQGENWTIVHDGQTVGTIRFDESTKQISFMIVPAFRQMHYGAHAVYLLTQYLHKDREIETIHARIERENEPAIHIVEHNGYMRVSENEGQVVYRHQFNRTSKDDGYQPEGYEVLYLAGGCFWGMERVFKVLDGVVETRVGYANGTIENPTYEQVCRLETGFKETVRVTYDPALVSLKTVLKAFFRCIDPTQSDGQAHDKGEQYKTGIYYRNMEMGPRIMEVYEQERQKYDAFFVECKPLECFYEAEEYHQDYLTKNPNGYCHITPVDLQHVKQLNQK